MADDLKTARWTAPDSDASDRLREAMRAAASWDVDEDRVDRFAAAVGPFLSHGPDGTVSSIAPSGAKAGAWKLGAWAAGGILVSVVTLTVTSSSFDLPSPSGAKTMAAPSSPVEPPLDVEPVDALLHAPSVVTDHDIDAPPPEAERRRAPAREAEFARSSEVETVETEPVELQTAEDADTFLEEVQLLREAQAALSVSPARALAVVGEHRLRFGASAVSEERDVVAIEALARLGRIEDAERAVTRFRQRYGSSSYTTRLNRALQASLNRER